MRMIEIIGDVALCALTAAALIEVVEWLANKAADAERHWRRDAEDETCRINTYRKKAK